ncbi:MAG: Transposase for insertion sequence element [Actinomycetia bacterium]|nr:Transposase for insertion sequence element [Actinomycetes bacterium]
MAAGNIVPLTGEFDEALAAASPDVLRTMVREFTQRMMVAEVEQVCGAGYGEVSPERVNSRNGYRAREWDTRAGTIELAIPRLRQGSYYPEWLLERRRRAERALVTVVATSYLLGVSTRRVEKLAESLGVTKLSKSQVSVMARELDGCRTTTQSWGHPTVGPGRARRSRFTSSPAVLPAPAHGGRLSFTVELLRSQGARGTSGRAVRRQAHRRPHEALVRKISGTSPAGAVEVACTRVVARSRPVYPLAHERSGGAVAGPEPGFVGRAGGHSRGRVLLRRGGVPRAARFAEGLREGRGGRCRGEASGPPAVPFRVGHAVVGGTGSTCHRAGLLGAGHRGGFGIGGRPGCRRTLCDIGPLRRGLSPRRAGLRHRLHRVWGAELVARPPAVGRRSSPNCSLRADSSTLPSSTRSASCSTTRRAGPSHTTTSRRARISRVGRARTPTRPLRPRTTSPSSGITCCRPSSPPSPEPGCGSSSCTNTTTRSIVSASCSCGTQVRSIGIRAALPATR